MTDNLSHFVGGRLVEGTSGRFGEVFNPATGQVTGRCPYASASEVDRAVQVALDAFTGWSRTAVTRRAQVVFAFRELLVRHSEELAVLVCREHGKTLPDARGEIQRAIEPIEFACGVPHLMKGEMTANIGGSIDNYSIREPIGVVVAISPFNFPAMIPLWEGAMAVACGNVVINKPSERVPSAPLFVAELWKRAGLPDGVWNVVNGDKEAVDALLAHPGVTAINFVGSTKVAEYVYHEGCRHNKRVGAYGGGKNHMIVLPDADLDQVADALLGAGYGSAGQRCMAISVAVPVGEQTGDELVRRLTPRVQQLRVGPYDDPKADFGPLITRQAMGRVEQLIEAGVSAGAVLAVDQRRTKVPGHESGFFLGGTLADRVRPEMEFYKEEIFGPTLQVVRAADLDQAVQLVNANEYGNGVAIFTRDGGAARAFCERVDVGMIGINVPIPVPSGAYNFGGAKRSKFGDSQLFGPDSVRFVTKVKTMSARWPSPTREGAQFAFPVGR